MSVPYFVRRLTIAEGRRLAEILRDPPKLQVFLRAKAVHLSSQGWKVPEIAPVVGRDRSVVARWLHRFDAEGLAGLHPGKSPGRPPKITEEYRRSVDAAARENPRDLGYPFTRWTTDLLREHLSRATDVDVCSETLRQTLVDLGFRWGRPKLDLKHRQDAGDVARAKRLRSGALKKR